MYESIKNNIIYDIKLFNNSLIRFLIIILIVSIVIKSLVLFLVTILLLIQTLGSKIPNIELSTYKKYKVIKISNRKNRIFHFYSNPFNILIYPIIYLLNLCQIKTFNITKSFIRTIAYNNSYSVIRYPTSFIIPDKCILLINHSWVLNQDIINMFQTLLLFPDHRYIVITRNVYTNIKILQLIGNKIGNTIYQQYTITPDNKDIDIYQDIYNFVSNNKKVVVFIFPEGNVYRTTSVKKYNVNKEYIDNFEIYDNRCFKYKKGAFIMSLMNQIPIIHSIFYSPVPNYDYNTIKIKHINHIGTKFYHPYLYPNVINQNSSFDIKNFIDINHDYIQLYMKQTEQKFYKRYIETLVESHKFNI